MLFEIYHVLTKGVDRMCEHIRYITYNKHQSAYLIV